MVQQRLAPEIRRRRCIGQLGDRRKEIDETDRRGIAFAGAGTPRKLDQQRDVKHLAVNKDSVFRLTMLVEAFAMIGHQDHDGLVVKAALFQIVDELSDDLIGGSDLSVVSAAVARPKRLDRFVWRMGLEDVQEEKEGPPAVRIDPALAHGHGIEP